MRKILELFLHVVVGGVPHGHFKTVGHRCATAAILCCRSSVDVAIGLPLRIGNMRSLPIFRETDPTAPSPSSLRRYGRWHSRPRRGTLTHDYK